MPRNVNARTAGVRKAGSANSGARDATVRAAGARSANGRRAKAAPVGASRNGTSGRGRPPKMVYINVLVKASTRSALTRLKSQAGAASQGAVIDGLVARALEGR